MRKLITIFAICFACIAQKPGLCDDAADIARAARKSSATVVSSTIRKNIDSDVNSRGVGITGVTANSERSSNSPRTELVIPEQSRMAKKSVSARSATNIQTRAETTATDKKVLGRSATPATRVATNAKNQTNKTSSARVAKTAKSVKKSNIGRAADMPQTTPKNQSAPIAESQKNYTQCKEVYYSCMDEFCANKDSQLKRCACSARINDFEDIKTTLTQTEEQLQDFNQRLLSVNMDAEDAAAMMTATEGELAYGQDDESESKKILDEIAKKLSDETSSESDSLTLKLDKAAAFDSIDSGMGSSTVSKEGTALYNAALPVCREMATEVCDETSASIVESSYEMAIEKDCNTVATVYENLQNTALQKTKEGSSLLDMSRLDIYQSRNSDDTLTCRKKMLATISDPSVCGTDLTRCLDITGKYINPSTGEAFLTEDLVNLNSVIIRPTENQTWTTVPNNKDFVAFLENKKDYLNTATKNCQDIASSIWDDFVEDAMAQIKLAQVKKLEEMRQGCTTLTAECLSDANTSISDFDSRALSIFGVAADKTVNEMCSSIKIACSALLQTTNTDSDWAAGMSEIQTMTTYDSIIETCREVGKACIIKQCTSISGNFGLCEDIEGSVNRQNIVRLNSDCWNEVFDCVADAGEEPVDDIMAYFAKDKASNGGEIGDFYSETYGTYTFLETSATDAYDICTATSTDICIFDVCASVCSTSSTECEKCRIAEKIWGNCEYIPTHSLKPVNATNRIITAKNDDNQTLLEWFAESTGTETEDYNCAYTTCAPGFTATLNTDGTYTCLDSSNITSDLATCPTSQQITISNQSGLTDPAWTNCCSTVKDSFGNCCMDESNVFVNNTDLTITNTSYFGTTTNTTDKLLICRPGSNYTPVLIAAFYVDPATGSFDYSVYGPGMNYLICLSGNSSNIISYLPPAPIGWPQGQTVQCNGQFIVVNATSGTYIDPTNGNYVNNYYSLDATNGAICTLGFGNTTATWTPSGGTTSLACDIIQNGTPAYPIATGTNSNDLKIDFN